MPSQHSAQASGSRERRSSAFARKRWPQGSRRRAPIRERTGRKAASFAARVPAHFVGEHGVSSLGARRLMVLLAAARTRAESSRHIASRRLRSPLRPRTATTRRAISRHPRPLAPIPRPHVLIHAMRTAAPEPPRRGASSPGRVHHRSPPSPAGWSTEGHDQGPSIDGSAPQQGHASRHHGPLASTRALPARRSAAGSSPNGPERPCPATIARSTEPASSLPSEKRVDHRCPSPVHVGPRDLSPDPCHCAR